MAQQTMVERVARALARADGERQFARLQTGLPPADFAEARWPDHVREARVAIAAMRDGTRAMYEAGAGEQGARSQEEWERAKSVAASAYLTIIDAALHDQ